MTIDHKVTNVPNLCCEHLVVKRAVKREHSYRSLSNIIPNSQMQENLQKNG